LLQVADLRTPAAAHLQATQRGAQGAGRQAAADGNGAGVLQRHGAWRSVLGSDEDIDIWDVYRL